MTTARAVPVTRDGQLEGDEALETLRSAGRRRLVLDAVSRFRAADGFSHARALAFQTTLTIVPALIAMIGGAAALDQPGVSRVVSGTISDIAPGAVGALLTDALHQGEVGARRESGETAVVAGFLAALLTGTTAMAQVERAANRVYGTERDRPFVRKYLNALALALTAGAAGLASVLVLVGGASIREGAGWGDEADAAWAVLRWPVGLALAVLAVALLFERAPRRRQPEPSWLAVGGAVSVVLWLAFMAVLKLYIEVTGSFGATYGPLAGTIGVLLWTFATSVALLLGLALAAQLEAVRAGVPDPRVPRDENL